MAKKEYGYMVRRDCRIPILIRYSNGAVETYRPLNKEEWARTPVKDSILEGSGDWVWYDDVPESDLEFWKEKITEASRKKD